MIKFLICKGIGFSPGDTRYLPTHGFVAAAAVAGTGDQAPLLLLGVGA